MFDDRRDAGQRLAAALSRYAGIKEGVILAIPRGGIVIGEALCRTLRLPLDIIMTKKIGHPLQPEYAIGVVNLNSELINEEIVDREEISREWLAAEIGRIRAALRKRYHQYRGDRPPLHLKGRVVILADDGIATGNTMMAAVRITRKEEASRVVVAAPVGGARAVAELGESADEVVCLEQPEDLFAIGNYYRRFEQVEDKEAIKLLAPKE